MLRAYITAKSTKLIMAMLLFGSISGFVLGQELHHPPAATHRVAVTRASAASSLGSSSSRVETTASHTQSASVTQSRPPARHKGHHHHDGTEGGSALTLSADSSGPVQASPGDGDSGNSGGDH